MPMHMPITSDATKFSPRIKNPKVAEILAPAVLAYYFGTKRATIEQRYYEVYNQENGTLINVKSNAIKEVVPQCAITKDSVRHEPDIPIPATGFDSVTGGILDIDIKGLHGQSLR